MHFMRVGEKEDNLFPAQTPSFGDNNICESALKKAILHRKNSSFDKTLNGAYTGDVFMSLIQTNELCGGNTFEYLVALLKNAASVEATPANWLSWTYQASLRDSLSR